VRLKLRQWDPFNLRPGDGTLLTLGFEYFFSILASYCVLRSICDVIGVAGSVEKPPFQTRFRMKFPTAVIFLALSASAFAEPTSSFRGDERHSGIYAGTGVPVLHGPKWRFRTKGAVVSSPAIAQNTAYVGSNDNYLYAINVADGTERWKFKTGSRVTSSPAVSAGVVYFGSYDGNIYALDASTGALRWKFKSEGEHRFTAKHLHGSEPAAESMPDPFDMFLSSPTVYQGVVYVGSGDGNVYALEANSGALRWSFKTGNVVHASAAVANDTVYIGSWDSFFYALDAKTGNERWRFKTGVDPVIFNQVGIQSSALVAGGLVYFGCRDANLYALDAQTGAKVWAFGNKGSWVISTPIVMGGVLYFATSDSGLIQAVDAKTGSLRYSLSFHHWPMFSSPAIAGGDLLIGSHAGTLMAIDLDKHAVAWTYRTDGAVRNAAAYTQKNGDPDYGAAFIDNFYDDLIIGVQRMMSVGSVLSSPVVADGVVYFGSSDGNVYAIG
jgi:outer membrane protein assembly factor BamB